MCLEKETFVAALNNLSRLAELSMVEIDTLVSFLETNEKEREFICKHAVGIETEEDIQEISKLFNKNIVTAFIHLVRGIGHLKEYFGEEDK